MQRGDKIIEYEDKKEKALSRDDLKCPEGWLWKGEWDKDTKRAVDDSGTYVYIRTVLLLQWNLWTAGSSLLGEVLIQSVLKNTVDPHESEKFGTSACSD